MRVKNPTFRLFIWVALLFVVVIGFSVEDYYSKIFEVWPPDVTRYLRTHGKKFEPIPPHNRQCTVFFSRFIPRINSPKSNGNYEIQQGIPLESQRLSLSVQTGPDVDQVYWFVNGRLVEEGKPDKICFWTPMPGKWEVSVVDSQGRTDKVNILVFDKKLENRKK